MKAHDLAKQASGRFLLRIEDIDQTRARNEWERQIYDDLSWLGLSWEAPVMRQSERLAIYRETLDQMWWDGFLYVCSCNRRDIANALSAPQEGVATHGPDGVIYPGTCRNDPEDRDHYPMPAPQQRALRLDWGQVPKGLDLTYFENDESELKEFSIDDLKRSVGDVVLARKDMGTSYHLSVVIDDAAQGITDVVRGEDLRKATPINVALQALLGLPTPRYTHHNLIRDGNGKRLAKRDDARALSKYRSEGANPNDIRRLVGLPEV